MAKGDWWFKFEFLLWLTDEQLNRCSLDTQGFWCRVICMMRKSDTARLQGSEVELCRLLSVTPAEFQKCFAEIKLTKTADVTQKSEIFTLMSRKFAKELKVREQNRLRKQRERRHANVPPQSQDRVISKSKEKEIRVEDTHVSSHTETVRVNGKNATPAKPTSLEQQNLTQEVMKLAGFQTGFPGTKQADWLAAIDHAGREGFTAVDIPKMGAWAAQWMNGSFTPANLVQNLAKWRQECSSKKPELTDAQLIARNAEQKRINDKLKEATRQRHADTRKL